MNTTIILTILMWTLTVAGFGFFHLPSNALHAEALHIGGLKLR